MDIFRADLFAGKRVVVTGGGTGIGFACATMFARLGGDVFIGSRSEEKLAGAAERAAKDNLTLHWASLDTRKTEAIEDFVNRVCDTIGGIDILINNAGGQFPAPAESYSPNGWDAVIRNNLHGTWYMTQAVANQCMIPQKSGKIVNIIANMWRGMPGIAHTGAARAGVANLTKSLAIEWAHHNIQINCVAPGVIKTGGLEVYPDDVMTGITSKIPAKRLGLAEEIAASTAFLASPAGDYYTGATLAQDGGQALWGDMWVIPEPKG